MGIHFPNKEMQMAFDAKQAVTDILTELEDRLKQAKQRQEQNALADAKHVAVIESEIAGWQALIAEPAPAKKTAARK